MNIDELRVLAAQGRIRHEPDLGFTIDGVLVSDEADHRECARVLGMTAIPPFVAPASPSPEPEREPMSGIALPDPGPMVTTAALSASTAPAGDAARELSTTPEPEED